MTTPQRQAIDRDAIVHLLAELAQRLDTRGVRANIMVVGGAAIALAHDPNRSTNDVDAWYNHQAAVDQEVQHLVHSHGLRVDWLNNRFVLGIPPGGLGEDLPPVMSFGSVVVACADPLPLLAMKINASRHAKDRDDIAILCRECGIRTVQQAVAIFEQHYPQDVVSDRGMKLLLDLLPNDEHALLNAPVPTSWPRSQALCSKWMPVAQTTCGLKPGHRGRCRRRA